MGFGGVGADGGGGGDCGPKGGAVSYERGTPVLPIVGHTVGTPPRRRVAGARLQGFISVVWGVWCVWGLGLGLGVRAAGFRVKDFGAGCCKKACG